MMEDTVRNFAIDWQDWASQQRLSYGELSYWTMCIRALAQLADPSGGLIEELRENGIL